MHTPHLDGVIDILRAFYPFLSNLENHVREAFFRPYNLLSRGWQFPSCRAENDRRITNFPKCHGQIRAIDSSG
jgi:hypothetical protein